MMSYLHTKFHDNWISSFRGVAMTRFWDGRTDRLLDLLLPLATQVKRDNGFFPSPNQCNDIFNRFAHMNWFLRWAMWPMGLLLISCSVTPQMLCTPNLLLIDLLNSVHERRTTFDEQRRTPTNSTGSPKRPRWPWNHTIIWETLSDNKPAWAKQ